MTKRDDPASYPNPMILEAIPDRQPGKDQATPVEAIDAALQLIDAWMAEESGYEEETWDELKAALDQDRPASRKLFPE